MATVTLAYDHSRDPMSPDDLADKIATALTLTAPPRVDISPTQIVVSHPNITSADTAAIQAVVNAYVLDVNRAGLPPGTLGTLLARAQQALTVNANYLAIPSPNAAQVSAQVTALTKECTALIRIAVNALDSTAGT